MEQVLIMQKASKNMVLIRIKHIRGLIIGLVRACIFLKILILQNGGHAQIQAPREEVLDLDNYKEYDLFLNRILEMQNEIECDAKNRMPVFSPEQQRAVYFDYYKKMYHISVIMYTFSKDCAKYGTFRTGEDLAQQKKLEKALNIAYHEKQICVSQKKCIKDLKVWYNGEDEVI